MYRHFLIAVDGSECSFMAAKQGTDLAKSLQAHITFVTVSSTWEAIGLSELALGHLEDEYSSRAEAFAHECLAKGGELANRAGLQFATVHVFGARPHEAILSNAESLNCDLIVVGSHGRHGVKRFLLGSEASKIVSLSKLSVLVARS